MTVESIVQFLPQAIGRYHVILTTAHTFKIDWDRILSTISSERASLLPISTQSQDDTVNDKQQTPP